MFLDKKTKNFDIINYLAPGFNYDKYLKAYGCELQKGHFPYEDSALPPQEAFYSRLKNEGISDEDYARCQAVWRDEQRSAPIRQRQYRRWSGHHISPLP